MLTSARPLLPPCDDHLGAMPKESLEELAQTSYWDKRYNESDGEDAFDTDGTGTYDWFKPFQTIRPFLEYHLPAVSIMPKILHLGCGNSVRTM